MRFSDYKNVGIKYKDTLSSHCTETGKYGEVASNSIFYEQVLFHAPFDILKRYFTTGRAVKHFIGLLRH